MIIVIHNNPGLPNKLIRLLKWKMHKLRRKFKKLVHVSLHIDTEGSSPKVFMGTVRLRIKGNEILIKQKSSDPAFLFRGMYKTAHLKLAEVHR